MILAIQIILQICMNFGLFEGNYFNGSSLNWREFEKWALKVGCICLYLKSGNVAESLNNHFGWFIFFLNLKILLNLTLLWNTRIYLISQDFNFCVCLLICYLFHLFTYSFVIHLRYFGEKKLQSNYKSFGVKVPIYHSLKKNWFGAEKKSSGKQISEHI